MKKSISIIVLIILLGVLIWFGKDYIFKNNKTDNVVQPTTNSGSISQILEENSGNQTPTQTQPTIDLGNLNALDYTGGGEYTGFSAEITKNSLAKGKNIILFFAASRDPTDQELDKDIQEHIARIPENTIILKVDYDTSTALKKAFNIAEQNTIIFLDKDGKEKTRRAVGITSLSQIVDVILDR